MKNIYIFIYAKQSGGDSGYLNKTLLRLLKDSEMEISILETQVKQMQNTLDEIQTCLHQVYCEIASTYVTNATTRKMKTIP